MRVRQAAGLPSYGLNRWPSYGLLRVAVDNAKHNRRMHSAEVQFTSDIGNGIVGAAEIEISGIRAWDNEDHVRGARDDLCNRSAHRFRKLSGS